MYSENCKRFIVLRGNYRIKTVIKVSSVKYSKKFVI